MDPDLASLLRGFGPWLLLVMAMAETAFVTGLVVPAGLATALGAFLAAEGALGLWSVAAAAGAGALLGDTCGFWLGRRCGRRLVEGDGWLRGLARRHEPRAARLFGRHPLYAVSFARVISFVRTLMPWMAGMSGLRYRRFLAYDLLGVGAWVAMYVACGYLAGRSWRWVSSALGTGWAVLFMVVGLAALLRSRRRTLRDPSTAQLAPSPETPGSGRGGTPVKEDRC